MSYRKVTKPMAHKLYKEGRIIILVPCKCGVDSSLSCEISFQGSLDDFDRTVNSFVYYNCNHETGRYVHYYLKEE